jgi:hypothetical protein
MNRRESIITALIASPLGLPLRVLLAAIVTLGDSNREVGAAKTSAARILYAAVRLRGEVARRRLDRSFEASPSRR